MPPDAAQRGGEGDRSPITRLRVAIVLFNLGGPDRPEAIRPFLLNLFRDPAILRVPFFIRPFLARFLANRRLVPATANYALLGGKSPLLELTQAQATALEAALPELEARCFIAMRYWHPFSEETARAVRAWRPDEVVLLPLYPQVLHHHDRQLSRRMAQRRIESRARRSGNFDLLLSRTPSVHRRHGRTDRG